MLLLIFNDLLFFQIKNIISNYLKFLFRNKLGTLFELFKDFL